MSGGPDPIALRDAVALLGELLQAHDGRVPASELDAAIAAGTVSRRTMTRARAALGTASVKVGRQWFVIRPYPTREVH